MITEIQKASLSIILVAVVVLITCDNPVWPEESKNPQPYCLKYDNLHLTLLFDRDFKLAQFLLDRPSTQIDTQLIFMAPESYAIPQKGAFCIPFNISYEDSRMIFGQPKLYSYVVSDTGVFVNAHWTFEDRSSITLTFLNDSLFGIGSNVKWVRLPKAIRIGATMDSVLFLYGRPSSAWESKSWSLEPLRILGVDLWVKSPQKVFESLNYSDQGLQLNLNRNNRLEEWVLRRPASKMVNMTQTDFDSSMIPQVGACGIFFNSSTEVIIKKFGDYHTCGWLVMDSTILTYLGWRWHDSLNISFELTNDSLRVITSNVGWVKLPKGVKIGDTKAAIIKVYGKPSLTHKMGLIYSQKALKIK